jgi:hypothetical protein
MLWDLFLSWERAAAMHMFSLSVISDQLYYSIKHGSYGRYAEIEYTCRLLQKNQTCAWLQHVTNIKKTTAITTQNVE